ncbi:MAG: type II secretion system protein [Candidatus Krumholzibacteriota bacterium]|nr:type II secretion system protein [Candidatus Krumholzibacteriota bacterium]
MRISDQSGFTLIELIITIVILGMIAYSFSSMYAGLLSASSHDDMMTRAAQIAENRMEDSVRSGVGIAPVSWTADSGYEWMRDVTVLKDSGGAPTLVKIEVRIRKDERIICSLVTHIAG